jgi:threonine dehydrogenase-like Zn-dependent dehydrogenase
LECVGHTRAGETALAIARPGRTVGRVGVPQHDSIAMARESFFIDVTISGGPAPVRAYIEELMSDVLDGSINPGRVLDKVTNLDGIPDGYHQMNDRESIKVLVKP